MRSHPTLPEHIAEQLATAIVGGRFVHGERICEEVIAKIHQVSRGPVREAFRLPRQYGLVRLLPRRGAIAEDTSANALADTLNIRAVLFGLAARCFARDPPPVGLAELSARVNDLQQLSTRPNVHARTFALAAARASRTLRRHCGNDRLADLLFEQDRGSIWSVKWRLRPLDFDTDLRRLEVAADFTQILSAIGRRDEHRAEYLGRKIVFGCRDAAVMKEGSRKRSACSGRLIRDPSIEAS